MKYILVAMIGMCLQITAQAQSKNNADYGYNIIAATPFLLTEDGKGPSISYERVLDRDKGYFRFYVPMILSFNRTDRYNPGGHYYSNLYMDQDLSFTQRVVEER